jgi:hypothetical protein
MVPGKPGPVNAGEIYRSDDPRVLGREFLFVDVYDLLGVEQATAVPGRKREAKKPVEVPVEDEPSVE